MITVQNKQRVLTKLFNDPFDVLIHNLDTVRELFCGTSGGVTIMVNHRNMKENI